MKPKNPKRKKKPVKTATMPRPQYGWRREWINADSGTGATARGPVGLQCVALAPARVSPYAPETEDRMYRIRAENGSNLDLYNATIVLHLLDSFSVPLAEAPRHNEHGAGYDVLLGPRGVGYRIVSVVTSGWRKDAHQRARTRLAMALRDAADLIEQPPVTAAAQRSRKARWRS